MHLGESESLSKHFRASAVNSAKVCATIGAANEACSGSGPGKSFPIVLRSLLQYRPPFQSDHLGPHWKRIG